MIKGISISKNSLNVLLLFGDDPFLFEKEIIKGFSDGIILGNTYNFSKEEVNVYVTVRVDKDETQTTIETTRYPKNDLIEYAIDVETYRSLDYIQKNYYNVEDYYRHQWIFAKILKCYLNAFKISIVDYPYRDYFIEYFAEIVKKSIFLYEGIFGNQFNLKDVKVKLQSDSSTNKTGYKLKPLIYNTKINLFIDRLIRNKFIDSKNRENFKQFLQGEIPPEKIEWKKELRYLVYFIKKLNEVKANKPLYLLSPPGQKWKYLYSIFSSDHSNLPEKFDETFNKLGEKYQREIDSLFDSLSL